MSALPSSSAPPPSNAPSSSNSFFVVAEGANGDTERFTDLWPVLLGREAWLHPSWVRLEANKFAENTLLGSAHAFCPAVFGFAPERLFAVCMDGPSSLGVRKFEGGGWKTLDSFPAFAEIPGQEFIGATPWFGGYLLALESLAAGEPVIRFLVVDARPGAPIPPTKLDGRRLSWFTAISSDSDETVYINQPFGKEGLAYWKRGMRGFRWIEPTIRGQGCAISFVRFVGDQGYAFGSNANGACGFAKRGRTWEPYGVPNGESQAGCYAREAGGREWLVTRHGEVSTGEGWLWRRNDERSDWQHVELPQPQMSRTAEAARENIRAVCVWAAGDNDVWVQGAYREHCDRGVVLHSKPIGTPCRVNSTNSYCVQPEEEALSVGCRGGFGGP